MERIDKVISDQTPYSRKEIKDLIGQKRVIINDEFVSKPNIKVDIEKDKIIVDGKELKIKKNVYLILNKPKGYVSATEDKNMITVLDLVPHEYLHRNLFPAGRLDKDTTGLMIITDDGVFAHNILAPKKHIKKTYKVEIDIPISNEMIYSFNNGVMLNDGKCKPAVLEKISEYVGIVVLTEGRYHQIKRMFGMFGAKVMELERIGMGNFKLPNDLISGQCRELTEEEMLLIRS